MSAGALDPLIHVALTCGGRAALDRYTAMLRQLPRLARDDHPAPAPYVRVGVADRDVAAGPLERGHAVRHARARDHRREPVLEGRGPGAQRTALTPEASAEPLAPWTAPCRERCGRC